MSELIASISGLRASTLRVAYGTSKAGVMHLTQQQAAEWGEWGVRVNCVCPGSVLTEATKQTKIPDGTDAALFGVMTPPLGHCQPEEIAGAILYLASDDARYVTGVAFPIDGGRTAV